MSLTADELRSILSYDPDTGVFVWLRRPMTGKATSWNSKYPGMTAGGLNNFGYLFISIHKKRYPAHRLAWLYTNGILVDEIDHINGNPIDNRVCNLRVATHKQNLRNSRRRSDNTSGFKGVYRHGKRWRAKINVDGRQIHLGTFDEKEAGHIAYAKAAAQHFGEFARLA